jgi:cobaltochelatase CobT
MAALLKPDLMREGIDGEAVQWACARMRERPALYRVLVVISDGCPMDRATSLANDEFYLASHLKQVLRRIEQQGDIAVCGLGVGLDLDPYFRNSLVLDLAQGVNNHNVDEIVRLIGSCVAGLR